MPPGKTPRDKAGTDRAIALNREARFQYEILDRFEAGLVLTGSEVKSARAGEVNLRESHVRVQGGEAWLVNCHFNPYKNAGYAQHEALRTRKLLLHAREIVKLARAAERQGLTVVPLRMYFSGARIKLEIAIARGKKLHDKRETIKKRDDERWTARH